MPKLLISRKFDTPGKKTRQAILWLSKLREFWSSVFKATKSDGEAALHFDSVSSVMCARPKKKI